MVVRHTNLVCDFNFYDSHGKACTLILPSLSYSSLTRVTGARMVAALKYEIRLVESFSNSQGLVDVPEHGRTKTCFEIFDELIPQLGVFQHVMKMIRDELCLAVFSKELTSAVNREGDSSVEEKDAPVHLSRVPYFTIALKWLNRRSVLNHIHTYLSLCSTVN